MNPKKYKKVKNLKIEKIYYNITNIEIRNKIKRISRSVSWK